MMLQKMAFYAFDKTLVNLLHFYQIATCFSALYYAIKCAIKNYYSRHNYYIFDHFYRFNICKKKPT